MELNIPIPSEQELMAQAQSGLTVADQYPVASPEEYEAAGANLKHITSRQKALEEMRASLKAPILEAGRRIDAFFKAPQDFLERLKSTVKRGMLAYDAAQERKRQDEEKRLREIARKERERLEAEARKAQEVARKKEEALKREAEAARMAGETAKAEKLETRAEKAVDKAAEKSAALEIEAASVPVPIVAREIPKAAGVRRVATWHARVIDAALVPREYLVVNQQALDQVARATKGAIKIPGIEMYSTISVAG